MKITRFGALFLMMLQVSLVCADFPRADCFNVLVGKNASVDGAVLFGHNEQNRGRCLPRLFNRNRQPRILQNVFDFMYFEIRIFL